MAPRKLPEKMKATQFKPGQSGNPTGARPLSDAQRALRSLTLEKFRDVIQTVLTGTLGQLREMIQDPKAPAIQVAVATAFVKAIKQGDYAVVERIAERIIGKIPETINLNTTGTTMVAQLDPNDPKVQTAVRAAMARLQADV